MRAVLCVVAVFAAGQPAFAQQAKGLPVATVRAWTAAGAKAGWMRPGDSAFIPFVDGGKAGDLPAFQFETWTAGVVPRLPVPDAPFALSLAGSRMTGAGLKDLAALKTLAALDLSGCDFRLEGIGNLPPLTNLTYLDLGVSGVNDRSLRDLAALKNLATLKLAGNSLDGSGLAALGGLASLTALDVANCKVRGVRDDPQFPTPSQWQAVSQLKNLTTLTLSGTDVVDKQLADVANLTKLAALDLSGCRWVSQVGMKKLASSGTLPNTLTALNVSGMAGAGARIGTAAFVPDEFVKALAPLKGLTTLDLARNAQVTDAGLKELAPLTNLTTLKLAGCSGITSVGQKALAPLSKLTTLSLAECRLDDPWLKELTAYRNLTALDLTTSFQNKITPAGLAALRMALPNCKVTR